MNNHALLTERISELKKRRKALILAHYYEDGEIQDVADFVGDSLALAQKGATSDAPVLLLAGVVFMAESVKLLSPNKIVLVPDLNAGCSLVNESPIAEYKGWKESHPGCVMVTYINSSAEVKAISDVIVTSSNAEKILRAIPKNREILFGPDRYLGRYLAKKLDRPMNLWKGSCQVHVLFSSQKLNELRVRHPKALVLAHPECVDEILEQADVIGSTSRLLEEVGARKDLSEFIVATEDGIFHQMKKLRPDVQLYQAPAEGSCACNQCPYMKLNTLEKIVNALENMGPEVTISADLASPARRSLQRMLQITNGEAIVID